MATATAASPSRRPESNWWLVVAGGLVVHLLAYAAFVVAFASIWFAILLGAAADAPFPALLFPVGGFVFLFGAMLVLFLVSVVLPVALYVDAAAAGDAPPDWDPDPVLYAGAAALGLFTQGLPIQPAVAAYYLYQRHQHVGTP